MPISEQKQVDYISKPDLFVFQFLYGRTHQNFRIFLFFILLSDVRVHLVTSYTKKKNANNGHHGN